MLCCGRADAEPQLHEDKHAKHSAQHTPELSRSYRSSVRDSERRVPPRVDTRMAPDDADAGDSGPNGSSPLAPLSATLFDGSDPVSPTSEEAGSPISSDERSHSPSDNGEPEQAAPESVTVSVASPVLTGKPTRPVPVLRAAAARYSDLLGSERGAHMDALLRRLPVDCMLLPDAVADVNLELLSGDTLAVLSSCIPTPAESSAVRTHVESGIAGAWDRLCVAEKFVFVSAFVAAYGARVRLLDLITRFDAEADELTAQYRAMRRGGSDSDVDGATQLVTLEAKRTGLLRQLSALDAEYARVYAAPSSPTKTPRPDAPEQVDARTGELSSAFSTHAAHRLASLHAQSVLASVSVSAPSTAASPSRMRELAEPHFDLAEWLSQWRAAEEEELARRAALEEAVEQEEEEEEVTPPLTRSASTPTRKSRSKDAPSLSRARSGSSAASASATSRSKSPVSEAARRRARALAYAKSSALKGLRGRNAALTEAELATRAKEAEARLIRQFRSPAPLECAIDEDDAEEVPSPRSTPPPPQEAVPPPLTTVLNDWSRIELTNLFPADVLAAALADPPPSSPTKARPPSSPSKNRGARRSGSPVRVAAATASPRRTPTSPQRLARTTPIGGPASPTPPPMSLTWSPTAGTPASPQFAITSRRVGTAPTPFAYATPIVTTTTAITTTATPSPRKKPAAVSPGRA